MKTLPIVIRTGWYVKKDEYPLCLQGKPRNDDRGIENGSEKWLLSKS